MAFAKFARFALVYNIAVIVWGAFVRASGSGAGCGRHWPLCNGTVVPIAPTAATIIEFVHRGTSGLCLVFAVALVVWARKIFPQGNPVRRSAWMVLVFTIIEALIGAGLVLFELVAHNTSGMRAVVISLHLVNTFLLLAALACTACWSGSVEMRRIRKFTTIDYAQGAALLCLILVAASGAIAALGDTLYPATDLASGFAADTAHDAPILVRLRVWHPIAAVCTAVLLASVAGKLRLQSADPAVLRFAFGVIATVVLQIGVGLFNLFLLAPTVLQLLHLLVADVLWIYAVLLFDANLRTRATAEAPAELEQPVAAQRLYQRGGLH